MNSKVPGDVKMQTSSQLEQENDMLKSKFVKGVLGASAVAVLFATLAVQAQTGNTSTPTGTTSKAGAAQGGTQTGTQSGTQTGTQTGSTASGTGTMAKGSLSRGDQKMVKDMAMSNMAEIEAARMAQTKSQNEQVKNFAQQMIDDHTKALSDVQQLAQAKGVMLPTELDRMHKRRAERMSAMSGEAFDKAYMDQAGVADHKKTHGLLRQAQSRAKDPDVKALAARTMPIVDQHLNSAQELHKNTARGSGATQGSTGASPDKKQ